MINITAIIPAEETFTQMLFRLMELKRMSGPELCWAARIDRRLFSKIKTQSNYQPQKDTVFRLALGLQLTVSETQKLLETAGYSLSRSICKDRVIEYCIINERQIIREVNLLLKENGCKPLR